MLGSREVFGVSLGIRRALAAVYLCVKHTLLCGGSPMLSDDKTSSL